MEREISHIEKLEKEGWTRRFIANEPRLSEAVNMYRESNFEVHLEPLPKESDCNSCITGNDENECRICFEGLEDQYKIIFTRPVRKESED